MDEQFDPNEDTELDEGRYESEGGFGSSTGSTSSGTGGTGTAARMQQTVTDKANEAKQKIEEFGRKTADQIDAQREPVANTLKRTASALHAQGENAASVAHTTADKLESTADYLRSNDLKAMMSDVQDLARRYPGQTLAAAVGLGFLLGRLIRRSD